MKTFSQHLITEAALGDCYEAAFHWLLDLDEDTTKKATLCHGMVSGQGSLDGKKFGHAWGEMDKMVYDYSNGQKNVLPKAVYYMMGKINESEVFRYQGRKGLVKGVRAKHYGPWDMTGVPVDVSSTSKTVSEEIPKRLNKIGKRKVKLSRNVLSIVKDRI